MQLFINNWSAVLTAPAPASAVQLSIDAVQAAKLIGLGAGDHYLLTLAQLDSSGAEIAWEIISVTDTSGGVLEVERAQEYTVALDLAAGVSISARLTAATMSGIVAALAGSGGASPYKGTYESLGEVGDAVINPQAGDYVDIDAGVGSEVLRYIWDASDLVWVAQGTPSAP